MDYVVCRECGARWEAEAQPRKCINESCGAGWLELPMFAEKADADRAAKNFEHGEGWLEAQLDLTHPDYAPRFVKNVVAARDDGFELCCVFCGVGVLAVRDVPFDPTEKHEDWCPCSGEEANMKAVANAEP